MKSRGGRQSPSLWRSDWMAALLIAFVALLVQQTTHFFDRLERRFFDFAATQTDRHPSDKVVILAIDDQSIRNIGRWPWSRDVHARMVDILAAAKTKTVVHTSFFFEPQADAGLQFVRQIEQALAGSPDAEPWVARVKGVIGNAKMGLDTDTRLADSLGQAGNVLLPAFATPGDGLGLPDTGLPAFANPLEGAAFATAKLLPVDSVQWPIAGLAERAVAVGHLTQLPDEVDGVVRASTLFLNHGGKVLPSLGLLAAAHALNLDPKGLARQKDGALVLGGLRLPIDARGQVFLQHHRGSTNAPAFVTDSFYEVYAGKIPASKYAGKVVIIGAVATEFSALLATPMGAALSPAALMAHETSSLLSNHFFETPDWATAAQHAVFLAVAIYLMFGLPRLARAPSAAVTGLLCAGLLLIEYWTVSRQHIWLPLVLPAVLLVLGYLGLTTRLLLVTEESKQKADEESAETNRVMGLALHGQGQLDMAFDRFRRVPLSHALMDNLLNLALDFERKRQFNKATAVYQYVATFDHQFKDLQAKLKRVKSLSETVLQEAANSHSGCTVGLGGSGIEKPILGHYQVEKELAKGAMGGVYLGQDPKTGQLVAIKTMALASEFDGEELEDARQRFFREAETAGRLQHPHIATIFDAGENDELVYIAMEFLKGKDLSEHTRVGRLLPVAQVVSVVARVAQALDYAHQLNMVHGDLKPSNIVYEDVSDTVKITGFGIAHVINVSRIRTGMAVNSSHFMSPEQIAGKNVDGRADLYSLGAIAFLLLTGVLPYRVESMSELMLKISNDPAQDVRAIRPDIPVALAMAVNKAIAKDLDVRYARGNDMASDLQHSQTGMLNVPPAGSASVDFEDTQPDFPEEFPTALVVPVSYERL